MLIMMMTVMMMMMTMVVMMMMMIMMMMMMMMMMTTVMIVIPFSSYCMLSTRSSWCAFIKLTSMEDVSHSHLLPYTFYCTD
jgi:hypothetical protein